MSILNLTAQSRWDISLGGYGCQTLSFQDIVNESSPIEIKGFCGHYSCLFEEKLNHYRVKGLGIAVEKPTRAGGNAHICNTCGNAIFYSKTYRPTSITKIYLEKERKKSEREEARREQEKMERETRETRRLPQKQRQAVATVTSDKLKAEVARGKARYGS